MFGLSGNPTLPTAEWLLTMLGLLGFIALAVYSRRGSHEEHRERLTRHRSLSARLALGAVVAFVLWFAITAAIGAGPLLRAMSGE